MMSPLAMGGQVFGVVRREGNEEAGWFGILRVGLLVHDTAG